MPLTSQPISVCAKYNARAFLTNGELWFPIGIYRWRTIPSSTRKYWRCENNRDTNYDGLRNLNNSEQLILFIAVICKMAKKFTYQPKQRKNKFNWSITCHVISIRRKTKKKNCHTYRMIFLYMTKRRHICAISYHAPPPRGCPLQASAWMQMSTRVIKLYT